MGTWKNAKKYLSNKDSARARLSKSEPTSNFNLPEVQDAEDSPDETQEEKEQSQLEELQAKFESAKKENSGLRSQIDYLTGEMQEKDTYIRRANRANREMGEQLKSISDNIRPLEKKLSPEQQQHIHSHDQPMIGVLTACLARFNRIEKERRGMLEQHQEEIGSLNQSYGHQIDELKDDHEIKMAQLESWHTQEIQKSQSEHDDAVQTLKGGFFEVETKLKAEISRLEVGLLTTVDNFRPIPDQKLVQKFTDLEMVISKFARDWSKNDPTRLGESWKRSTFIDIATNGHHKFLIQSVLWESLADGFFSTPFRVFGQSGDNFFKIWQSLFGKASSVHIPRSEWPRPDKASEKWRSVTFETLKNRRESRVVASSGDEETKQDYLSNLSRVEDALFTTLHLNSPYDRPQPIVQSIREMVKIASELALDFGTQRCRLELFIPQANQEISQDRRTYVDINNENHQLARGVIKLAVVPGIRRIGDGRGSSYRETIGLRPASVYLKPID